MLPKIDLCDGRDEKRILEDLRTAIIEYGAFYVKFPSVSLVDSELFSQAKQLFSTAPDKRKSIRNQGFIRGFIENGQESGSDSKEEKEGFSFGVDISTKPQNKLEGPNVDWPEGMDSKPLMHLLNTCQEITYVLTRLLSILFTGDESSWMDLCQAGDRISIMRVFHYFAMDISSLGSSAHTDWGFLSFIKAQETIPGLQVAQKGAHGELTWQDVPAIPPGESTCQDWFICNAGDFLSMITKGNVLSPLHRVISTSAERTAFVYFAYPSYNAPIPAFLSPNMSLYQDQSATTTNSIGVRRVEKIQDFDSFGDFIFEKWNSVSRY